MIGSQLSCHAQMRAKSHTCGHPVPLMHPVPLTAPAPAAPPATRNQPGSRARNRRDVTTRRLYPYQCHIVTVPATWTRI